MLTHDLSERSAIEAPRVVTWVEGLAVRPFFQPILDLSTGQPLGYEVLSRGSAPFGSPEVMFNLAKELGALWDLERACRMAALQRISRLPPRLRASRFFLNVNPQILSDPWFIEGFTLGALRELGLDQDGIVIEIMEKDSIRDYQRFEELVRQWATGANPLTGLPGNPMIQRWIQEAVANPPFSLIYADLDRFKEYNDRYGFVMGDEVIRFTAHVLSEELAALSPRAHLGHLGGDDFVIVYGGLVAEPALERICRIFDEARLSRFDPEDRERGFFIASDRRGRRVEVPLVTLSLAVIDSRHLAGDVHPAHLAQIAASLKARVKGITEAERRSGFAFERRNVQVERTIAAI